MAQYLITHEDIEDSLWFGEPFMFDSEDEARRWAEKQNAPAMGTCRVLYRCDVIATLAGATTNAD